MRKRRRRREMRRRRRRWRRRQIMSVNVIQFSHKHEATDKYNS